MVMHIFHNIYTLPFILCILTHVHALHSSVSGWFNSYKYDTEQLLELTPKQNPCALFVNHELPGNILVKGWHNHHIAVSIHKKTNTLDDEERIACTLIQNKNGTVTLTVSANDDVQKQVAVELTIHVPLHTTITIKGHENIAIEDTHGTVRMDTESGVIRTYNTHGAVYADTEQGDIFVTEAYGIIEVYTERGSITIQQSHNSISAETERGSITAQCTHIPSTATVKLETHKHGTIQLAVPEATEASLIADTTRGTINSDVLITLERYTTLLNPDTYKETQKHVRGRIGEGALSNIIINSARGISIIPNSVASV